MATALNMTMKLKQDAQSRQQLAELKRNFATAIQPAIDAVFKESEIVHYARLLVVDDRYIQVLTEFDGSADEYTEFFRLKLPNVFKAIFALVEGVPPWDELNDRDTFFRVARSLNQPALGNVAPGDNSQGYLFSAYGNATVKDIKRALA
jgi:hypothetical protein